MRGNGPWLETQDSNCVLRVRGQEAPRRSVTHLEGNLDIQSRVLLAPHLTHAPGHAAKMEMDGRKCGLSLPQDLSSAILLSADDNGGPSNPPVLFPKLRYFNHM